MSNWEAYEDRLASIRLEWNRAEEVIKLAEQLGSKVVLPSVAELRYAGRRIIEALSKIAEDAPEDVIIGLLQDAEFDCQRARHDAIDSTTANIGIDLKNIVRKIGFEVILKCCPEYPTMVTDLNNIREKIAKSRKKREEREAIYTSIEVEDFEEIVRHYTALMASEDIMKSMARNRRIERVISYGIGVGGLLFAAATIIL